MLLSGLLPVPFFEMAVMRVQLSDGMLYINIHKFEVGVRKCEIGKDSPNRSSTDLLGV
jgi:hypothetical protein